MITSVTLLYIFAVGIGIVSFDAAISAHLRLTLCFIAPTLLTLGGGFLATFSAAGFTGTAIDFVLFMTSISCIFSSTLLITHNAYAKLLHDFCANTKTKLKFP